MPRRIFPAFLMLGAALAQPAVADPAPNQLANGTYHCEVYALGVFIHLGDIVIEGDTYRGPFHFGAPPEPYKYELSPEGEVTWLGPLGGFTSGGNSVDITQVTKNSKQAASFDIIMREASGNYSATTCDKQ
ncbi:hypothetical protein [Mesorhizobium sp. KR2-14]|uniref:hypothetical protein n=1 Tax=Mesorhizobium sp. KR2-14 TaxID=3156610 RepID=UPI0032B510EA